MRRRRVPSWELEAWDETERLRQALDSLRRLNVGTPLGAEFFGTLNHVNDVARKSFQWIARWKQSVTPQDAVQSMVYDIFQSGLIALAYCVDVYNWSLSLYVVSPDLDAGDGDLAASGIATVQKVSTFALLLIEDTPGLKSRDQRAAQTTVEGLGIQLRSLVVVGDKIHEVLAERRQEEGYN